MDQHQERDATEGGSGRDDDLSAPSEDDVDLSAPPGSEAHDRAQEAVMREGAADAATEAPAFPSGGGDGEPDGG